MAEPSLPSAPLVNVGPDVVLQPPVSRCGEGPGLIIVRPGGYARCQAENGSLDPEPLQKWAEESYAVAQITVPHAQSDSDYLLGRFNSAVHALQSYARCSSKDRLGLLGMLNC